MIPLSFPQIFSGGVALFFVLLLLVRRFELRSPDDDAHHRAEVNRVFYPVCTIALIASVLAFIFVP